MRKKVDELAEYYTTCREQQLLPAIPGAVILTTEAKVDVQGQRGATRSSGWCSSPEEEGTLRALDGQHRLLALAALLHDAAGAEGERAAARRLQVPAILFAGLPADHVVELFVTINAKHTRLNQSLLVSLCGRQLYGDAELARGARRDPRAERRPGVGRWPGGDQAARAWARGGCSRPASRRR